MKKLIIILVAITIAMQTRAQWTAVGTAFTGAVRSLHFPDENTGYAVGGDGVTFGFAAKTTDGGATWSSTTISGSNLMRGISFVDANTGYICGQGGVVLKTADAGNTWVNIYTNAAQYFRAVDFVSSTTGFLAGAVGTILKTTDGGLTWTTYSLGVTSDVIQVNMIDANNGYACASFSTAPFSSGYIFRTSDGGSSWSQVYSDAVHGLLGQSVVDANTAYVGGQDQNIVKTTDGGATWNTAYVGYLGPAIRTGSVVSGNQIYMADDYGYIQNTNDEGATWTNFYYVGEALLSMSFPSSSVGYVGGLSGTVYKHVAGSSCTIDPPIGLTSVAVSPDREEIYWTQLPGQTKYTIRYRNANGTWKLNNNTTVRLLKNLEPNTTYSWQVKAYCGWPVAGTSKWSDKAFFTTLAERVGDSQMSSSFNVYPNPFSSTATIDFTLDKDSRVTAELYSIDGKKVMSLTDRQFPAGENEITLNRESLSSGLYILHLKTDDELLVRKIVIE